VNPEPFPAGAPNSTCCQGRQCACIIVSCVINFRVYFSTQTAGIAQSVWRPAMGWAVRGSYPTGREIFRTRQEYPRRHPASCSIGTGFLGRGKNGESMMLTTYPLLAPGLRLGCNYTSSCIGMSWGDLYLYLKRLIVFQNSVQREMAGWYIGEGVAVSGRSQLWRNIAVFGWRDIKITQNLSQFSYREILVAGFFEYEQERHLQTAHGGTATNSPFFPSR